MGAFERWPRLLDARGPVPHVTGRGGRLVTTLASADYLVVGDRRARGKAELVRRAQEQRESKGRPEVLDEHAFLHLVRPKLEGRRVLFVGGLSPGLDMGGPAALVEAVGAQMASPEDAEVDLCVVGAGRARGKTALLRELQERSAEGARLDIVDEELFLDLLRCLRGPQDERFDFRSLAIHLRALTDPKKVERAVRMLKRETMQLFSDVQEDGIGGIVKSQTQEDEYYACWLRADGQYGCFDRSLSACLGQSGDLCKHLVVLLVGLSAGAGLDARRAHAWAALAAKKWQSDDAGPSAELILRYRGAEAGEQDWRPTETVPEDYYAL